MLSKEQAIARFSVVTIIELLGFIVCLSPLIPWQSEWKYWQIDCMIVGGAAIILAFILAVIFFSWGGLTSVEKNNTRQISGFSEWGIRIFYSINITALLLVIARTGGPAKSLFSPLIPIQLSGILFQQIYKDRIAGNRKILIGLFYFVTSIGLLWCSHKFGDSIAKWSFFPTDDPPVKFGDEHEGWKILITALGMGIAYLMYFLPDSRKFNTLINRRYAKSS